MYGTWRVPRCRASDDRAQSQTSAASGARENGRCFYCLRRITGRMQCIDHVHPRAHMGLNSYRNLVSTCMECNSRKGEMPATDFLRWLYREQRLTPAELTARLRSLQTLSAGHLRPTLP